MAKAKKEADEAVEEKDEKPAKPAKKAPAKKAAKKPAKADKDEATDAEVTPEDKTETVEEAMDAAAAPAPGETEEEKEEEKPKPKAKPKKKGTVVPQGPRRDPHGKKYQEAAKLIDREKRYDVTEAVDLLKKTATVKFDATVELHFRLGLDPRNAEQNIRGTVKLPAGTGKTLKVLAFVPDAQAAAAKKAGADFVADEATKKKIADGWADFDVAVATPDQMTEVAKLGKVLGPKGLMPNPKAGTVSPDPAKAIGEVKKGTIEYRLAKDSTVHAGVGKISFAEADLVANLKTYFQAILHAKPSDLKGTYIKSVTVASTMGPGIKLNPASLS